MIKAAVLACAGIMLLCLSRQSQAQGLAAQLEDGK
jgi:hypothetical protein